MQQLNACSLHQESFKPVSHDCDRLGRYKKLISTRTDGRATDLPVWPEARHPSRPPGTTASARLAGLCPARQALRRSGIVQSSANFDAARGLSHATSFPQCQPMRIRLSLAASARVGLLPSPNYATAAQTRQENCGLRVKNKILQIIA